MAAGFATNESTTAGVGEVDMRFLGLAMKLQVPGGFYQMARLQRIAGRLNRHSRHAGSREVKLVGERGRDANTHKTQTKKCTRPGVCRSRRWSNCNLGLL